MSKKINEVRYSADDQDDKNPYEVVVTLDGNGDLRIAVVLKGSGIIGKTAKLSKLDGVDLISSAMDMYRAMQKIQNDKKAKEEGK